MAGFIPTPHVCSPSDELCHDDNAARKRDLKPEQSDELFDASFKVLLHIFNSIDVNQAISGLAGNSN